MGGSLGSRRVMRSSRKTARPVGIADIGMYAQSYNAFLTDLADGAQTFVDLVGVYGQASYVFNG